jgi:hypothetical protein
MNNKQTTRFTRAPIRPDRVRRIGGDGRGFAFLPNRFLHGGFFASLTHRERSLYLFLVLAGDRDGVSFYAYDRICSALELTVEDYIEVRNHLIAMDLIAFDGTRFQVLSLPDRPIASVRPPLTSIDDLESDDPATVHQLAHSSLSKR